MKTGNRAVEEYIDLLIESFKRNKNLPYQIKTGSSCPDKKKNCKKKHGDIVVKEYDKNNGKFHVFHYAIHQTKSVFDWWQEEKVIKEIIKKSTIKFSYGKKPLLRIKELKKILNKNSNRWLNERLMIRMTTEEKKKLITNSKRNDLKLSEYVRKKLFS